MGRRSVRRVDLPPRRRLQDALVLAGVAIVLLFAVVGVVSAGAFVGGKLSSGSPAKHQASPTGTPSSLAGLARANAQATAIVKSARSHSRAVLARANKQARAIVGAARRHAASVSPTAAPTPPVSAAPPVVPTPTPAAAAVQPTLATGPISATPATTAGPTNLSGLPASWLVVAYNVTFGGGPGSAGSITVTNRGGKAFSGVARVMYARGGSATAAFTSLAPGRTTVLPLDGSRYPGGGYHIVVPNPR